MQAASTDALMSLAPPNTALTIAATTDKTTVRELAQMKRTTIVLAWLLGLAAIAWSCSARQGATHSSAPRGLDTALNVPTPARVGHPTIQEAV